MLSDYYENQARRIEDAKAELAREYGLERNSRFECAWNIAWQYGHSNGIDEVKICFSDLVELIKT